MTNPKRDEKSMDEHVPAEIELRSIGLSFTLGAGKNLSRSWQRELRTESESRFRATVTRSSLEISFSPPILIDAQWPAMNMQLGGVKRDFSTGETTAILGSIHGVAEGLIDYSDDAKKEVCALITMGIMGTAMAHMGYNPMQDPRIVSTLEAVGDHFRGQPQEKPSEIEYSDFGAPRVDMTMVMKTDFRHIEKKAGLSVCRGTTIDVSISGSGNLATMMASRTTADKVNAAKIHSVTIVSDGLLVIVNDKPIAYLDRMRIDHGGAVTLEKLRLEGTAGEIAGIETLIRVMSSAMQWAASGRGIDDGMTMAMNSGDAQAKVIPDIVRGEIEKTLTEGVKQLLRANRAVVPEVDIEEVFLA
jgi:hypothetical protein